MRASKWILSSTMVLLALSGCTPDEFVYFQNNTDHAVYLGSRDLKPGDEVNRRIPPEETARMRLVSQGECTDRWLLYDENGGDQGSWGDVLA